MKTNFALSTFIALTLTLVACQPKSAPTIEAPTSEPTTDPYAASIDETASFDTLSIEVSDQPIDQDTVTVTTVNAVVDGWVVIHTEADGKPGPVIGYTQVPAGESIDVKVTVDASQATPKLFAMLHVDEGTKGTYEFPGADVPVKEGDVIVMRAFNQAEATNSAPYVTAEDQTIVDGTVWVAAAMDGPGWVAIHAEADAKDGQPGPVIGYAQIPGGVWDDLKITVDESKATATLYAMLHVDAGVAGTYEFPGDDVPVRDGDGIIVMEGFYQQIPDKPSVAIDNQSITQSIVLTGVIVTTVPSWLVIHADADGKPGPVIGYVQLAKPGRYQGLPVKLDESQATPTLFAMLHIDEGILGTYEFPGADVPVKDGDMIVMVPFEIK